MTTPLAPKGPIYRVIRRFEHAIVLALLRADDARHRGLHA